MILPNKIYNGVIQSVSDSTDGKFKVYIPSLMSHDENFKSVSCKNKIGSYCKWTNPDTQEVQSIGTYIPLQPGMPVEVVFSTSSYMSGTITSLHFDNIPLNKDDQTSFYLFGKTLNGTRIYSDDKRNITHICHNDGKSNVLLMDDKVTLSVDDCAPGIGGNNIGAIELSRSGIFLKFGENALVIDDSGIHALCGENKFEFGSKEMNWKTEKFTVSAKDFEINADKAYITGKEELHLKSTVTRVSGGQQLALTGNTVAIDSTIMTHISSTTSLVLSSLLHASMSSSVIDIEGFANTSVSGMSTVINGTASATINGTSLFLNGATIFEDSQVIRGMGIGSAGANSMVAMSTALRYSLKAADIALTTAFHIGDPFSGMVCNVMTESLNGTAQGVPNQMPFVSVKPNVDYMNTILQYITRGEKVGDLGTRDLMWSLKGNTVEKVYQTTNSL